MAETPTGNSPPTTSKERCLLVRRTIAALLLWAAVAGAAWLTAPPAFAQEQDLVEDYPELDVDDLPERYQTWLVREVRWLITDDERDFFLRMDTDAKRDRFIEAFWARRDPTPGTPENEYHEVHYQRLAYADFNFGRVSPDPGWRTDMGRVYILLGAPASRQTFHNDSALVPLELWFYQMDPDAGLPVFFYLIFFRDLGTGSFELYSPLADGASALLNPSGKEAVLSAGRRSGGGFGPFGDRATFDFLRSINTELSEAAFNLIPGEARQASMLQSDVLINKIFELRDRIMPNSDWASSILVGAADTDVRFEALTVEARAIGWLDPDGLPYVGYVARAPGAWNVGEFEGEGYLTFTVGTYLKDSSQRVVEETPLKRVQLPLSPAQQRRVREGALLYMDRLPAVAGPVELDIVLENNVSREFGQASLPVKVPSPNPTELTLGAPIFLLDARAVPDYDPFAPHLPFQIGEVAMTPSVDGPFLAGGQVQVFHQILLPDSWGEAIVVSYSLLDAGGELVGTRQSAIPAGRADSFGVVNQIVGVELDVPPGQYTLLVQLNGRDEIETLPLRVAREVERPIVHAGQVPASTDPALLTRRAAVLRASGRIEEAIVILDDVLRRAPNHREALDLQLQLLRDGGYFARVEALLVPRLAERPQDADLLVLLAEASAQQGQHYDAIRYYERARLGGREDPEILNSLAASYLASEEIDSDQARDKAIELLRRSLEMDSSQAGIRALLERTEESGAEFR